MQRNDDSFWLAIFRKNPLIASIMFVGCIIGAAAGLYPWFYSEIIIIRMVLFMMLIGAIIGGFIGLVIGVVIDTFVNTIRGDDKNKRRDRR